MSAQADAFDARLALRAQGLLRTFNAAGVLTAADVHVATRLGALAGERDDRVLLAVALATRAPRVGHVHTDLSTVAEGTVVEGSDVDDTEPLPWPNPAEWIAAVRVSPLVVPGYDDARRAPLRLLGSRLALDRYWHEERRVAADLLALDVPADAVDEDALAAGLARLFPPDPTAPPGEPDLQARAAETAVRRRLTVVAGGPGTGKTTTVRKIAALLIGQADALGVPRPMVALAAPTGKAAARMEEALRQGAGDDDVPGDVADAIGLLSAGTLHRLLGWLPDARNRFRHHRGNRLPHDVVIVDESSMVSLSLMARLVEAIRPDARLILVGDPGQLVSVEAGAVLDDIVGPARSGAPRGGLGDAVVVLRRNRRSGPRISAVADAISAGDADGTVAALQAGAPEVTWWATDAADPDSDATADIRARTVDVGRAVFASAAAGDAAGALEGLARLRVLCAHRHGPYGASWWTRSIETWLAEAIREFDPSREWYVGRPLLVSANDYGLRLFNGDTGVVVADGADGTAAAFARLDGPARYAPTRLGTVDTVHAMTIHKAQGSQFRTVVVVLPPPSSPLLTRELFYTGLTRAQDHVVLVGTEEAVRQAVERPAGRATGLRERLWGAGGGSGA